MMKNYACMQAIAQDPITRVCSKWCKGSYAKPLKDSMMLTESNVRDAQCRNKGSILSTEPSELMSEPVIDESYIEVQPKVWSDAPIIEEYESDRMMSLSLPPGSLRIKDIMHRSVNFKNLQQTCEGKPGERFTTNLLNNALTTCVACHERESNTKLLVRPKTKDKTSAILISKTKGYDVNSVGRKGINDGNSAMPETPQQIELKSTKVVNALYGVIKLTEHGLKCYFIYFLVEEWITERGTLDKTSLPKGRTQTHDLSFLFTVYVDDIILWVKKMSWCDEFEGRLMIDQDKYVAEILKKFDFASVKTASTPIETQMPVVKAEESQFSSHSIRPLPFKCPLKEVLGGCQFLGRRLITWQCKKQTIIATSTTEAEYVAAAIYHSKTKHIAIRHHFIRDAYEKKLIQVLKIHTNDNVADLLTKAFDVKYKALEQCVSGLHESQSILFNKLKHTMANQTCSKKPLNSYAPPFYPSRFNYTRELLVKFLEDHLMLVNALRRFRESLRRVTDGAEAFLILTLFILCLDKVSTDHAKLVPLGKVCTAKETLEKNTAKGTKCKLEPLISLTDDLSLLSNMAALESCPKHNMIAYLEKTEGNVEFHEVIDFLFMRSLHITAKVAGKVVSISEASIRTDLIFDDADGIDSLPNQAIFNAIQRMGYEGDLTVLTFNKALFSPQWRRANIMKDHLRHNLHPSPAPTSKYLMTSTYSSPAQTSEVPIEQQPDPSSRPSPTTTIPDSIPETSGGNLGDQAKEIPKTWKAQNHKAQSKRKTFSTDRQNEGSEEKNEGTEENFEGTEEEIAAQATQTPTSTIFGDDETIAKKLIDLGLLLQDHFSPLPKIDPKDKGKKKIKEEDESESESDDIDFMLEKLQNKKKQFTIEERAKFLHDTIAAQRKFLAQQRSEAIRNRPPTKNQLRNQMMTYLKHEVKDFISIGSAEDERLIKRMNEKGVDSSKSEVLKEESKEEVQKESKEEESTRKRKLVLEKKKRFQDKIPEGFDRVLWGDLMVMFNPDDEDEFWKSQLDWNIVSWKLHSSSGVHTLVTETGLVIHMLVEKKYPLRKEVMMKMLNLKLESEEDSTMAD
ncbi:hypothetical protein Tco_1569601 [Tanacetum coccineum]